MSNHLSSQSSSRTRLAVLALVGLTGLALATGTSYSIIVAGQVATKKAIVVDGETYVPLSALKALGVSGSLKGSTLTLATGATASQPATGGANQKPSLEGCLGETLFNGVWRLRVSKLEPVRDPVDASRPGWALSVELRNGSSKTTSMMSTGFGASSGGTDPQLILPSGNSLSLDGNDFLAAWSKDVVQGGSLNFRLRFYFPRGTTAGQVARPTKFLMQINPTIPSYIGVAYTVPNPSFRVKLDCQK